MHADTCARSRYDVVNLTGGKKKNDCVAALHWTSVAASGAARIQPDGGVTSDQMVVYTNMLTYAFECRTSVEAAVIKLAQDMLGE